ncbi:MAG: HAD family hydrolase [Planctomycetota bacterium]
MGEPPLARGVLLDRDGTLIEERHFITCSEDVHLLPGAAGALASLQRAGYRLVVVTNQSGVARGYLTREKLEEIHEHLDGLLRRAGVELDGILYCPHHPRGTIPAYTRACRCRKPSPGLIEEALHAFALDPQTSWVIGDSARDLACAAAWPLRRILVSTGYGEGARTSPELRACPPHHVVADLVEAARCILAPDPGEACIRYPPRIVP